VRPPGQQPCLTIHGLHMLNGTDAVRRCISSLGNRRAITLLLTMLHQENLCFSCSSSKSPELIPAQEIQATQWSLILITSRLAAVWSDVDLRAAAKWSPASTALSLTLQTHILRTVVRRPERNLQSAETVASSSGHPACRPATSN
jgi:hypothetical protein